jgi:oligopeptide/dipeptide ABC transporter ATP-binding protein
VDGVSFSIEKGKTLGIVGESGSGKSVTCLTIMGLNNKRNTISSGEALFNGKDLLRMSPGELRRIRGNDVAMIFQDPMTSLNPVYRVGWQIEEQLRAHEDMSAKQARRRTLELLGAVGIPNPQARVDDYPHQFSGGMRQRVMIAMGISCNPDVLIADEPTTALDVTIQAQILELIGNLQREFDSAVVLITHDLGVVAEVANRVAVMYAGRIVEYAEVRELFRRPQHPYTWGLLGSISRMDRPRQRRLAAITGQPPSLISLPAGCSFRPRCPHAFDRCRAERPDLVARSGAGHLDACFLAADEKLARQVAQPEAS